MKLVKVKKSDVNNSSVNVSRVENLVKSDVSKNLENLETLSLEARFEDLIHRADEITRECEDFEVRSDTIYYNGNEHILYFQDVEDNAHSFNLSDHSFSQLCGKIGVPVNYVAKCRKNGLIGLAESNVNNWLFKQSKYYSVRTYRDRVRAVLSPRYSKCDTDEILGVLGDTLKLEEFECRGSYLSEERFHLRLVNRNEPLFKNDDLYWGIAIDSSDVGRSPLNVGLIVYKQVCTNGLVVPKSVGNLFKQKHIGITAEEFRSGLSRNLDNIPYVVNEVTKMVTESKNEKLDGKALKILIESIKNNTPFDEEQVENVISLTKERYNLNRWGLINGLTEVAQVLTLEKRLEVERYAGTLLVA